MTLNGILVVDKPSGPTSHDVVARVRHAIGETRIGHTGTLDPLATGVLALLVGRATRLAQFLTSDDKEYVADVRLGRSTPTYDAEGLADASRSCLLHSEVSDASPGFRPQAQDLAAALREFLGTYLQSPPPFSAKKIAGTRAYKLARREARVELKPVEVVVTALEALPTGDPMLVRLRLVCSSGFYVRSLAHDLGQRLGCGAHLEALRRTRAGQFTLERAVTLDAVQSDPPAALSRLLPMEDLLPGLPRVTLDAAGARRVAHGNTVGAANLATDTQTDGFPPRVRLFDPDGRLLAIADARPGGLLHPAVVLL